jgi:hypothetical protein
MVAADAHDVFIETLVIWRGTTCDEDTHGLTSQLTFDASANTFGGSSHDCDPTV